VRLSDARQIAAGGARRPLFPDSAPVSGQPMKKTRSALDHKRPDVFAVSHFGGDAGD